VAKTRAHGLATSLPARSALVERTIATHPDGVTHLTAPHFYVHDAEVLGLIEAIADGVFA